MSSSSSSSSSTTEASVQSQTPTTTTSENNKNGSNGDASLTSCLLSQYRLCAAGIGLGTAYSLRYKRGLGPMIAAGAIGTTADMVYGYLVECADFVGGNAKEDERRDE